MSEAKKLILCVDDEPAIVEFMALMFEREGLLFVVGEIERTTPRAFVPIGYGSRRQ